MKLIKDLIKVKFNKKIKTLYENIKIEIEDEIYDLYRQIDDCDNSVDFFHIEKNCTSDIITSYCYSEFGSFDSIYTISINNDSSLFFKNMINEINYLIRLNK